MMSLLYELVGVILAVFLPIKAGFLLVALLKFKENLVLVKDNCGSYSKREVLLL